MNEKPKKLISVLLMAIITLILSLFLIIGISSNQRQSIDNALKTVLERYKN